MISLAFYWSLAVSQFFDVKRKDFWQMFIHHIATICLMAFSWICNLHRIGTLVLLIHDCADIFLEVSSMKYFPLEVSFFRHAIYLVGHYHERAKQYNEEFDSMIPFMPFC